MSDVAVDSGGAFDLCGFSDTIDGLNGVGVVYNIAPHSRKPPLSETAASEEVDGQIENQGSSLVLVLNADNSRDTFIRAGDDIATGQTTTDDGSPQIDDGGTKGSIASIVIDANATLASDRSNAANLFRSISGFSGLSFDRGTTCIVANCASFIGQAGVASGALLDLGNGSAVGSRARRKSSTMANLISTTPARSS